MKLTLKQKLVEWLRANPGLHASGSLQRLEWRDSRGKLASPSNLSRRLRELAEDGKITVEYIRGHAHYSYTPQRRVITKVEVIDGKAYKREVEVEY